MCLFVSRSQKQRTVLYSCLRPENHPDRVYAVSPN
jgi:hypothetical protein